MDPELQRVSHLALIGSLEVPGEPRGMNEMLVMEVEEGKSAKKSGRDHKIETGGTSLSRRRIATVLSVLGSVGYYGGGP